MAKPHKQKHSGAGEFRIIAGQWRRRKLPIVVAEGLRPTPDRVRETLFSWLQPYLDGAKCLDLFTGSGALAFEALSRGAQSIDMIESNPRVANQLNANIRLLATEDASVHIMQAERFLRETQQTFDIVFIDPPYDENLWAETMQQVADAAILADHSVIYFEQPGYIDQPELPMGWQVLRSKKAAQVTFYLVGQES